VPVLTALALAGGTPTGAAAAGATTHQGHAAAPRAAVTTTSSSGAQRAQLATTVTRELARSSARDADYRVSVAGIGTVSHASRRETAPASNEKLLTAVTLLQQVGAGFHYTTPVLTNGQLVGSTLVGDLVLQGSGDPTLIKADLTQLADNVRAAGIRTVTGRLVVDDSRYSHKTLVAGWKSSFVPSESGPVDAFTVDRNTWRGGTSFDTDPTKDNAGLWRTALSKAKVHVDGATTVGRATGVLTTVTTHRSGPLSEILDETLTNSDNFDAEMMLREAGAQRAGHGGVSSGLAAVTAEAAALHVSLGTVHDGSGLSYDDRETPATYVAFLKAVAALPTSATLRAALPVSCRTGTLQHRLCGRHVTGRVVAKTGTLDGVRTLSGWTRTRSGRVVTFSFLLSGIRDMTTAQDRLDAAVASLATLTY
jgi:D-alanyl-D-alanine carboxypeptidase/D-alanyl-D-alanine-endopeptidase (penicillin-binding protein 4)